MAAMRLRADGAGVIFVGVFGLRGEVMAAHTEFDGIAKNGELVAYLNNRDELAFVANFFAGQTVVGKVEPGVSSGIGDGLNEFVREGAIGGIDELAVDRARANVAAGDVLERLDGIEYAADVLEVNAAVIGAESEAARIVGRVATGECRGEALVLSWREKDVEFVVESSLAAEHRRGVNDGADVAVGERCGPGSEGQDELVAEGVAVVSDLADILVSDMGKAAAAKIV